MANGVYTSYFSYLLLVMVEIIMVYVGGVMVNTSTSKTFKKKIIVIGTIFVPLNFIVRTVCGIEELLLKYLEIFM